MGVLLKGQQRTTEPQDPGKSALSSGTPCEKDGVSHAHPTLVGETGQAIPPCISTSCPECLIVLFGGHREGN